MSLLDRIRAGRQVDYDQPPDDAVLIAAREAASFAMLVHDTMVGLRRTMITMRRITKAIRRSRKAAVARSCTARTHSRGTTRARRGGRRRTASRSTARSGSSSPGEPAPGDAARPHLIGAAA